MPTQLPSEIIYIIASYLDLDDCKNLSLACRRYFSLISSVLFQDIRCKWSDLSVFCEQHFALHVKSLTLGGLGEWPNSPLLQRHVDWPHFTRLEVSMNSSSSAWLKYTSSSSLPLKILVVNCSGLDRVHIFDFEHLEKMPHLKRIELSNCEIITPEIPHPCINQVKLVNCTWNYPCELAEIGTLTQLEIILPSPNPFAFSERLQYAANNPPATLDELRLHLSLNHSPSWRPLRNGSPSLKFVSLHGFERITCEKLPSLIKLVQT